MCIRLILPIVLLQLSNIFGEDTVLTFTDKYCITKSPNAVAVLNEPTTPTYIPIFSSSLILTCKFDSKHPCTTQFANQPWRKAQWLGGKNNEFILDKRWNDFQVFRNEDNRYILAATINSNFAMPFSFRIENQTDLLLCEDKFVSQSTCYWMLLHASDKKKITLQKCIPGSCDVVTNTTVKSNALSSDVWNHFKVKYISNKIELLDKNDEILLNYQDMKPISIRYFLIRSRMWNIHSYEHILSTSPANVNIGPPFATEAHKKYCISMFVIMCKECTIKFKIQNRTNVFTTNEFSTLDEQWKEIKFTFSFNTSLSHASLYTVTNSPGVSTQFWALDDIRECQEEEYLIYQSKVGGKIDCQPLSSKPYESVYVKNDFPIEKLQRNCSEATFGENCIPCKWINNESHLCESLKYCEFYASGTKKCFCSAGYHDGTNTNQCSNQCIQGKYGHYCKETCGMCQKLCNPIDGNCEELCYDNYSGLKCDHPSHLRLAVAPKIEKIHFDYVVVKIKNFSVNGDGTPKEYQIQLQKDGTEEWKNVGQAQKFYDSVDILIPGLEADTKYVIRGILNSNSNTNYSYKGDLNEKIPFTTDCNDITENDIYVRDKNSTSILFNFQRKRHDCRFNRYVVLINNVKINLSDKGNEISTLVSPLCPAKTYEFVVKRDTKSICKKIVTTLEAEPSPVRELQQIKPLSPTAINLKWREPSTKNSVSLNYTIEWKLTRHLACGNDNFNSDVKTLKIDKTEVEINDLEPYSSYDVKVFPFNSVTNGIYDQISANTSSSERVEPEELPTVNIDNDPSYTTISFKKECKKFQGPLFAHFSCSCCHPWCQSVESVPKEVVDCNQNNGQNKISLFNRLFAYSNYTAHVKFCRQRNECKTGYYLETWQNFTTSFNVPHPIKNIEATSTGPNIIDLRWIPPYPPTGTLEKYFVSSYDPKTQKMLPEEEFEPLACKLWPEYHCAKISGKLNPKTKYIIKVTAKNKEFSLRSNQSQIEVLTEESAPESSYDLRVHWNNDPNSLYLFWNHPNRTNGILKGFKIIVNGTYYKNRNIHDEYKMLNEDQYNITYTYNVTGLKLPDVLKISIIPFNKAGDGTPLEETVVSPVYFTVTTSNFKNSINVEISSVDQQNDKIDPSHFTLFVLISNTSSSTSDTAELLDFERKITKGNYEADLKFHTIVEHRGRLDLPTKINIKNFLSEDSTKNVMIMPGATYNISVIIVHQFSNQTCARTVSALQMFTDDVESQARAGNGDGTKGGGAIYSLILLLFLLPLVGYGYIRYRRKINASTSLERIISTSNDGLPPSASLQPGIPLTTVSAKNNSDDEKVINVVQPVPRKRKTKVPSQELNKKYSKLVKVHDFEQYVKTSIDNNELKRQHDVFPRGLTQNANYGGAKENKPKNRYKNVVAYDHNRIHLTKLEGDSYSDYINASYIDGYQASKAYIATQGPKANTVYDFWRMIWQEKVKHIIMLANVYEGQKKKTEKYWPEVGEEMIFNEIKIQFGSKEIHANFQYRTLIVTVNQSVREIEQLHYTTWPDHGVPLYSQNLVPFLQRILKIPNSSKSPVVVHCSAGVGRTGTIILCDITLRMAAMEGSVDLFATLKKLRSQRPNMVDNIEQYKLAHLVVLECLSGLNTSIPCNKDMQGVVENIIASYDIKQQIRYIKDTEWQDEAMKAMCNTGEEIPNYPDKNRFPDIIPENHCRIFISPYPPSDVSSSYINAISVDGFCNPGMYIVTQQPLPNTVGDFWRMVYERKVTVIVSLNDIDFSDETMCQFWPTDEDTEMRPVDYITLRWKKTQNLSSGTLTFIHLLNNKTPENEYVVRIINFNGWKKHEKFPSKLDSLLMFLEEANAIARRSHPTLITCFDGATASGIYIAMSFLIEKMKLEHECDVCQAVRSIRHNRKQFIDSKEQMEYLYRASAKFIKTFQRYSNFDGQ